MKNKLIISAPFGNYFNYKNVISTIGTFTLNKRGNIPYRIWKVLSTVRYDYTTKSWINNLGLLNPGIHSVKSATEKIISIHGFSSNEWVELVKIAIDKNPLAIEFNVSCPNVDEVNIKDIIPAIELLNKDKLIIKLPPIDYMDYVDKLVSLGVNHFHLCNTIPHKQGGISGKLLKPISLQAIKEVKSKYGNSVIITGGGGVSSIRDVLDYRCAGADNVAIASMLFNPFNWVKVFTLRKLNEKISSAYI